MAEQLDAEANNLCILEDAFEKFQAVSMYQEEEFIMLPQTEPSNTKPPEPDDNNPPPVISEVVVSTCNDVNNSVNSEIYEIESFENSLNSSCVDSSANITGLGLLGQEKGTSIIDSNDKEQLSSNEYNHGNCTDLNVSNSENVNNESNTAVNSNLVPRKRGRKPKKLSVQTEESSALGVPKHIQNPDISSTPFSSDPEMPEAVPVVRRKRGRPPKALSHEYNNTIPNNSDKDAASELSSSDNNRADDSFPKKTRGRRGRPKGSSNKLPQIVNQEQLLSSESQVKEDLTPVAELAVENLNSVELPRKRKRKSAVSNLAKTDIDGNNINPDTEETLNDVLGDDHLDDICLSKLRSVPEHSILSKSGEENGSTDYKTESLLDVSKDVSSEDIEGQPSKVRKRRGRPKRSTAQLVEKLEPVADHVVLSEGSHVKVDDADDMCLSKLKSMSSETAPAKIEFEIFGNEVQLSVVQQLEAEPSSDINVLEVPDTEITVSNMSQHNSECDDTPTKRNTKMPIMADFEYNIDSLLEKENADTGADNSLLVEDTSKRPIRRKIKKFKYEEESDEDPFANVELSDDEPRRGRRGTKYYSDDEYIPGKRGNDAIVTSTDTEVSDSGLNIKIDDNKKQRRKKLRKKSDNQSPRKRGKKDDDQKPTTSDVTSLDQNQEITHTNDIEICLEPTVIKASDGESQHSQPSQWGTTTEFENFLAKKIQGTNLKIKKVSSNTIQADSNKMDIPVIDPEAKKSIEMCTQTSVVPTTSKAVQTATPYDIPMKENIALTPEQSEKACYFLNGIVKTTAELGILMTQKSEDFIKKKINTSHVTDTLKMDYCVKKSFLLFKLAKHNLLQMEEDLAKQYNQFLEAHNLTKCREEQKEVTPNTKDANSDSDCEIVDVKPSLPIKPQQKAPAKPAFNPKTVFLNKELSIKIAKKPSDNKKIDIQGRHTVWINDTVMVKKVKPTQSFLAQDSRNKKPPDNIITTEMVSNFFKEYNRERVLSACAPFVSTNWLTAYTECVCNYFVVKPPQYKNNNTDYSDDGFNISSTGSTMSEPNLNLSDEGTAVSSPDTLFTLCFHKLTTQLFCKELNHIKEITYVTRHELTDVKKVPVSLFRLCLRTINDITTKNKITKNKREICPKNTSSKPEAFTDDTITESFSTDTTLPLKSLCHRRIVGLLAETSGNSIETKKEFCVDITYSLENANDSLPKSVKEMELQTKNNKNGIMSLLSLCIGHIQRDQHSQPIEKNKYSTKSLFSLCVEYIQKIQRINERNKIIILTPLPLKKVALETVNHLLYKSKESETEGLMIDCVNTLSEEAFLNLEQCNTDIPDSSEYLDDFDNEENFEPDLTEAENDQNVPSWASQVQMHELRSCVNNTDVNEHQVMTPIITQIKLEPLYDETDNLLDSVAVKTEPVPGPDEMTIIPDVKPEIDEHVTAGPIQRQNSNSYDENAFEKFVSCNKLMRSITEANTEEIYSQSSERVRRQHEPDYYAESNPDMLGLLVPHTYTPVSIQTAKGSLMESSSDESNKNAKSAPKKSVRRSRGRPKKSEQKSNNKDSPTVNSVITPTPNPSSNISAPTKEKEKQKGLSSEVAVLTRKMKERLRQEEKNNESTDSENESVTVRLRSKEKKDTSDQTKDKTIPSSKSKNNEIQCSNVDSTDQRDESIGTFTGFTSIETNEMTNYEKYMKFVYNKLIPEHEVQNNIEPNGSSLASNNNIKDTEQLDLDDTPLIELNEPVELLECEPTLPIFDKNFLAKAKKTIKSKTKAAVSDNIDATAKAALSSATGASIDANSAAVVIPKHTNLSFIDRHGWQCYPVDPRDSKLYSNACIYLEKLPESFVQTYFEYQNIAIKDKSDEEINRLTNLNTLNRATLKDRKSQNSSKRDGKDDKTGHVTEDDSRTVSAVDSDHFDELMPSDDEGPRVEDEVPAPVVRQTENTLAKNLLMNDNESEEDDGVRVKQEPIEGSSTLSPKKSSKKNAAHKAEEPASDLMLTADKMMNKELTLLHAPVVMDQKVTLAKGPVTRQNKKSGTKPSPPSNKVKGEEDSSSEEEKQWVSTKEKLLKRLGKKESPSADDAKRAKLVSEFIERREGNPDCRKRGLRARRSGKKFLERQKQLRVLQRELFGETSIDPVSKRSGTAWKGRRNIRKVLDKKSLARSTVIANMEEFERKRRLNARQTKLRELLGCEEGVNVLVINDEVCLEYDFEEHRPVVTIHPFFTKVMKAHQYEGVKFMWDACFESLADIEAGHAGGGCILAHCMGLGKTLQVLALLHTVLTHPRVGMQRVLVCCPLSTVLNWVDEIHKWIGPVTNQIKVFELSKLKKTYERAYQLEDWYNGGGIFIIGYELFRSLSTLDPELDDVRPTIINKIRTALLDPGPDIIVCDEGHLLKNDCSVLAVSMSRVATKRRIVLTGTPMQNNLREYYCMVNFVKPNLLGTYSEYSNRFENPIMNGQHRDSLEEDIKLMKARTHILHKVLEGCLQRQEVSVLYPYLPKKHEYTVFITLTKCQWDLYKHYLNHYSKQKQNKQNSILKDFHILQKIWSHPQVLHNFQTKAQDARNKVKLEKLEDDLAREDHSEIKEDIATELWWLQYLEGGDMLNSLEVSNKFVVVFKILDECVALGDKVLIFSTSLFCLDALEYFLKKINNWSLGQEYYRLDGSVPAEVRQKWCREFNAENNVNTKVFLVSTRAGCLGLNMTAANRVIIMDTSWNPAHDIQSIFRVYRFGQKKDCFIYRLVALGTMEQKIYERSVTKQAVACRVVDEQQIDRHYNMAELTELYRYDEAGVSVACGVAVGVSDVALLRVARHTALHAVHEHDSLLRSSEQGLPEHERAAAWMQFQQEQAHKQMENKLITNIPKISLKRMQGNNYSHSFELNDFKIKTEEIPKEESAEEFVPKTVGKNKRGRPPGRNVNRPAGPSGKPVGRPTKTTKPIDIDEPGPSTDLTRDEQSDEEMMVHKITEILIKHNFQSTGNTNITNLVTKVREIFNKGFLFNDDSDELTSSIAKVLLAKKMSIPTLTGIMCDSINNSHQPGVSAEEPELILGTATSESVETGTDTRRRRNAALAAEKQFGRPGIIKEEPELILSTATTETTVAASGSRRKRKAVVAAVRQSDISVEEPELILSTDNSEKAPTVPDSRKKRKAAKAAEKHIESLSNDAIINLDDELDATDSDFVPEIIDKPEKSQLSKRKYGLKETTPKESDDDDRFSATETYTNEPDSILGDTDTERPVAKPKSKPKAGPRIYKERLKQKAQEATTNEVIHTSGERSNSILLSDEDEIFINTAAESNTTTVHNTSSSAEDTEVLPLPLALLTNQNFINIVAHTYLNGNPMLDADAATLAAQYSTYKSLKEAEQTGKDITSGPIYDIAVQVIGKEIFRKMNNASATANRLSVEEATVSNELKEKMQEMSGRKSIEVKKEKSRKKKTESSDSQNSNWFETDSSQPIASQYPNGNVVPVGLIKTAGGIQSDEFASSECILPDDDDDLHIVPHDLPALPQLHPAPGYPLRLANSIPSRKSPTPPSNVIPANPAPIVLSNLFATQKTIPDTKPNNVIKINKGKIFIPASATSGKNIHMIATAPLQKPSDDTICLDSDEEETITPAVVTPALPVPLTNLAPMPVSFTIEQPSEMQSTSSSITPIISAQETPQKTSLVLRKVGSAGSQQFVLVSTGKIVTSKLASSTTPPKLSNSLTAPKLPSSVTVPFRNLTTPTASGSVTAPKLTGTITGPKSASSITTPKSSSSIITPKLSSSTTASNSSNTTTAPKLLRKIAPKDIVATPDMQRMLETINAENSKLSTKAPSATCLSKLKQARCKPGDIIKITETGEIEVVSLQTLKTPPKSSPSDVKPKPSLSEGTSSFSNASKTKLSQSGVAKPKSSLTDIAKPKSSLSDIAKSKSLPKNSNTVLKQNAAIHQAKKNNAVPNTPKQVVANQTTKPRSLSISSSSSDSGPASPVDDNPLSIFKNVVHIQAADDTPSTSNVNKTNAIRSQKIGDSSVYVQHTYASKTSTKAAPAKIPTAQNKDSKPKDLPKSKDVVKPSSSKSSSNMLFNKSVKKLPTSSGSNVKTAASGSNIKSAAIGSNIKSTASGSNIKSGASGSNIKTAASGSNIKSTASGSNIKSTASGSNIKSTASGSKTIDSKINPSNNKTFHTVDLTQIPKVTVGSGASILMTKIEAKKRVSTGETSAPKKKKSELTLEDFSLDDIDDIIELD